MDPHLLNDLDLAVEPCGAALYQRHIRCQTHPVDMAPRVQVIQRIKDDTETREPVDVELAVLDVGMVGLQLRAGLELARNLLRDLIERGDAALSGYPRAQTECEVRREDGRMDGGNAEITHQSLWFLDVLVSEEELTVQVAQIDRVKVDDVDFAEAGEKEVLEELAAYAAGAYEQHTRLR